jgi:UDPglucose 6-dehydrogenase
MKKENRSKNRLNKPLEEKKREKTENVEKVSLVGLGKLGLCIATCLAHKGYRVFGVDIDPQKISLVNRGICPISEPLLPEMLKACNNRLTATNEYDYAIKNSDVTFIVVATPSNPDGSYSLEQIIPAAEEIGRALKDKDGFHVVDVISTVIPGSISTVVQPILEEHSGKKCGVGFGLCYNPEFIALGSVIKGFLNPDFVLIGESDAKSGEIIARIHKKTCDNNPPIFRMNHFNAELAKIALNSYITMKISFANTLAEICERMPDGDVNSVTSALGLDKRIGPKYLKGALGFGGPCFPRDNKAFSFFARQVGCQAELAEASDRVNDRQVGRIVRIVKQKIGNKGRIAVLGLTYKPNTNIVEESQPLHIAKALAESGYSVTVYDPMGMDNAKKSLGNKVEYATSVIECTANAHLCIIATPWDEFNKLDPEDFTAETSKPTVIDCWGVLDQDRFSREMEYIRIGTYLTHGKTHTRNFGEYLTKGGEKI